MDDKMRAFLKRNTFREYPDRAPAKIPEYPVKLYIEATSLCNLNCAMCFRKTWINEKYGNIITRTVLSVFDEPMFLKNTKTVFFGGQGEPLIHPDIMLMISEAKKRGKEVQLITNGTSLNKTVSEKLVELGADEIWVSIDSFDPEGYGKIQVGSSFGQVVKNIEDFNVARKGSGTKLGLTFVVMKSNILQLTAFERFADYIQADDVNISNMIPNTPQMEEETLAYQTILEDYIHPFYYDEDETVVAMFRMTEKDLVENPGIEKLLDENRTLLWRGKPLLRKENTCKFINEGECFIRWDGEVMPCMALLHSAKTCLYRTERTIMSHTFGNVNRQSFSEIWNSKEYSRFRTLVSAFNYAPCTTCGGCVSVEKDEEDCITSEGPVCGACLWGQGIAKCP